MQELAWRDYWQNIWIAKGDDINIDLKNQQSPVLNYQIPKAIIEAKSGIEVVDQAIRNLFQTGYMHNHMRMYVASVCCNIANCHWLEPSKWMYAHLLDGDLASNQLSWQWVAGAFSNKKYFANQDNINKYFNSKQKNTFLDVEYENFEVPESLITTEKFTLDTYLPTAETPKIKKDQTTLIYNYYNLDPYWHAADLDVQRVLLLEPSVFKENPVSQKCIDFVLNLAKNISGIQVFVGEYSDLLNQVSPDQIIYKEHPKNRHYQGHEEPREWLSNISGYYPSFFAFWKKCKKELINSLKEQNQNTHRFPDSQI